LIYGEEDGAEGGKKSFVRGFDVFGIEPGGAGMGAALFLESRNVF
jgi:hypothetical protein